MTIDEERDWFVTTAKDFGHELGMLRAGIIDTLAPMIPLGTPTWRGTCANCYWEFSSRTRREAGFSACTGEDPTPAHVIMFEKRKNDGSV